MSVSELANQPIELTFGGEKWKVSRMPIRELFAPFEAKIVGEARDNIMAVAASLSGKEKGEFIAQAVREIPHGAALSSAAHELLQTAEGMVDLLFRAFSKHQAVSEEQILQVLMRSTEEEQAMMVGFLMGTDYERTKEIVDKAKEEEAKKK